MVLGGESRGAVNVAKFVGHALSGAVITAALLVVPASTTPAFAVTAPYPIYDVPALPPGLDAKVAPDGRFATMTGQGDGAMHINLPFGDQRTSMLSGFTADSGGVFAYRVGDRDTVQLLRVATGEITDIDIVMPAAESPPWLINPPTVQVSLLSVVDVDASGTVWLLSTNAYAALYDTKTGVLNTFPSFDPADCPPSGIALSDDGRYYTMQQCDFAGGIHGRTIRVRYDRTGATPPRYASPNPHAAGHERYTTSPDLTWIVTFGFHTTETGGFERVVYRQHPATESEDIVPVGAESVEGFAVDDSGRVVVSHLFDNDSLQLSLWSGSGELQLLTVGWDGEPADLGVDPSGPVPRLSRNGGRLTFTSASTNLPGYHPLAGVSKRLFQISLPPAQHDSPSQPLVANQSLCLPAAGAAPGEYVGVNVTPVEASASGYGVLHSSDDGPGTTSNVNFGPGTVDPNVSFTRVGVDGEVCFTNSRHGRVDVVIDEMVIANAGMFDVPPAVRLPYRALDTREPPGVPVAAGGQRCVTLSKNSLEDQFAGVNTTPVGAQAPGFGTIHTALMSPGESSTVNFGPGTIDPNFAFVRTFGNDICFSNSPHGPVHVVIDELVLDAANALRAPDNSDGGRPVDTRVGLGRNRLGPSESVCFAVAGSNPGEFVGVNITPVGAITGGFGTLHSSDNAPGPISNVNFAPGTIDPNFAMAKVGADGHVCFTNSPHGPVDVVIDAQVIADPQSLRLPSADGSVRLLDTRE